MATHPKLLDAVEDLIGPDIMIYHNTAWIKEPSDDAYVSWHQDNTYFGHDPCEVLTAWIALSPATEQSGCMQFLPGSQKGGLRNLKAPDIGSGNMLSSGQNVDISGDQIDPVSVVLQPGEASIHHAFLVHGSLPIKVMTGAWASLSSTTRPISARSVKVGRARYSFVVRTGLENLITNKHPCPMTMKAMPYGTSKRLPPTGARSANLAMQQ